MYGALEITLRTLASGMTSRLSHALQGDMDK